MSKVDTLRERLERGAGPRPASPSLRRGFDWGQYVVCIALVIVFVVFAATLSDQGFLTKTNLLNIVSQTATISVMAVAMTFVISAAEIDLSVGAVAGLSSVITAIVIEHAGLVAGFLAGLGTGCVVGAINGGLVTFIRIPSFLVTLGMLGVANGTAMWVTNSAPKPILNQTFNNFFGSGQVWGIPSLVIWTLVAVAIGFVVLRQTPYGRYVLATGGNEEAARFSG